MTENLIDYYEVVFNHSLFAPEIGHQLEYSFDLDNWTIAKDGVAGVAVTFHATTREYTVRIPTGTHQRIYIRFKVFTGAP